MDQSRGYALGRSPPESALLFYPRHWATTALKLARLGALVWRVNRMRRRIARDQAQQPYTDIAIMRFGEEQEGRLELLQECPRREPTVSV